MYHYVRRLRNSRFPEIKGLELGLFVEQLEYIHKHYNVVSMEDVLAASIDNAALPEKPLLLTFDDAYAEHFTHVYPLLKKFDMQGSFYVPAKTVLEHQVLDVNKIHFILAAAHSTDNLIGSLKQELERHQQHYPLATFDEYFSEFAVANRFDTKEVIFIKRMLQHVLPEDLRNTIADKLFEQHLGMNEDAFARELYMDKYQLEQLVSDGMHVGCHGYDHYWWNKLSADALTHELEQSMEFMASLGCDMNNWTACYPYGSSSDEVVAALEKQGCKLALTTEVRVADLAQDHLLLIPRLDTNDLPKQANAEPNHWYEKA
jgi:peptidoglycan/xylan/chitin deacetylase (PgdA/CDA1 family)